MKKFTAVARSPSVALLREVVHHGKIRWQAQTVPFANPGREKGRSQRFATLLKDTSPRT